MNKLLKMFELHIKTVLRVGVYQSKGVLLSLSGQGVGSLRAMSGAAQKVDCGRGPGTVDSDATLVCCLG